MRHVDSWTLAAWSVAALAAAMAAVAVHQLLEPLALSPGGSTPGLGRLARSLGMSLAAMIAFGGVAGVVARFGERVEREGRDRPGLVLAVAVGPWLLCVAWFVWMTT